MARFRELAAELEPTLPFSENKPLLEPEVRRSVGADIRAENDRKHQERQDIENQHIQRVQTGRLLELSKHGQYVVSVNGEEKTINKGETRRKRDDIRKDISWFESFQWLVYPMYMLIALTAVVLFVIGLTRLMKENGISELFFAVLLINLFSMSSGAWLSAKLGGIDSSVDELRSIVDGLEILQERLDEEVQKLSGQAVVLKDEAAEFQQGVTILEGHIKQFNNLNLKIHREMGDQEHCQRQIEEINAIVENLVDIASITEKTQLLSAYLAADTDGETGLSRQEYLSFEARLLKNTRRAWLSQFPSFDSLIGPDESRKSDPLLEFPRFREAVKKFMILRGKQKAEEDAQRERNKRMAYVSKTSRSLASASAALAADIEV